MSPGNKIFGAISKVDHDTHMARIENRMSASHRAITVENFMTPKPKTRFVMGEHRHREGDQEML